MSGNLEPGVFIEFTGKNSCTCVSMSMVDKLVL